MSGEVLIVAGEASGDVMAAPVVQRLGRPVFGLGGPALERCGLEPIAPWTAAGVMGIGAVLQRLPAVARAFTALLDGAARRRPRAALLVGFSEFNARLGPRLKQLGIRVLWYAPPQVWAWRPARAAGLARAADCMAVILPFEQALWRSHGAEALYVGHPALEQVRQSPEELRKQLGLQAAAIRVAVLPGSRTAEVRRHLAPMLGAVRLLRAGGSCMDARVLVAEGLPRSVRDRITRAAAAADVPALHGHAGALPAFDVALAASGTVTLECVLAGVPPLIVHRASRLTAAIARRLLRVDSIGLPNIVLGGRAFPELVQSDVRPERLARELERLLDQQTARPACGAVRDRLEAPLADRGQTPSARVAALIEPWLS